MFESLKTIQLVGWGSFQDQTSSASWRRWLKRTSLSTFLYSQQKSKWSSGQTTETSPWLFVLHMFLLKIQQSTRIRCKNSSRGRNVSVKNGEAVFNKWWKDNAIVDRQESRPLPALPFQDAPASTSCKVDFWPSALKCWWSSDVCYQDEGYKFSGLGHSSLF